MAVKTQKQKRVLFVFASDFPKTEKISQAKAAGTATAAKYKARKTQIFIADSSIFQEAKGTKVQTDINRHINTKGRLSSFKRARPFTVRAVRKVNVEAASEATA